MAETKKAVDKKSHGKKITFWQTRSERDSAKAVSENSESAYRDYVQSINRSHDREIERSLKLSY